LASARWGAAAGRSLIGAAEFHHPSFAHPLDGDGGCFTTNPRYFNCSAAAAGTLRLCPCADVQPVDVSGL
jgi:hypothetical protein